MIEQALSREPDLVVNIGSGDGYYATGLALRAPKARGVAFDISHRAQRATTALAELNHVSDRLEVRGACEVQTLAQLAAGSQRPFIFCDCEGFEAELFTKDTVDAYRNTTLIIECHAPKGSDAMRRRLTSVFSDSHNVESIVEGGRNPNEFPDLRLESSLFRWIAVCEFRPCQMDWLYVFPKQAAT
ncbi:MAG: hypothetical protein K2X60_10395 [Xanthobacteraceae bacterium]|nr:hypothetical protein [Xanthobacteraceae bacterium]